MTIRVLIADDHVIMRDGLKALLSANSDIEVVAEVGNGRDAVRQAQRFKPNVILMDLAMPELNGIEAAGLLREACPEARIVMLSMHSTSEHLYRALEAGVTGYVLKESAAREVVAAVRAAYVGQRYLSQALADRVDLNPASRRAGPLDSLSACASVAQKRRDLPQPAHEETRRERSRGAGQVRDPAWHNAVRLSPIPNPLL
jgi:DNA-binding NarL/FixJ family response regulator